MLILLIKTLKFDLKDLDYQGSMKSAIFLTAEINSCKNSVSIYTQTMLIFSTYKSK